MRMEIVGYGPPHSLSPRHMGVFRDCDCLNFNLIIRTGVSLNFFYVSYLAGLEGRRKLSLKQR